MPISKTLLDTLKAKREAALAGGGEQKLEKLRSQGNMTARDRLDALFTENTFLEFGLHAHHENHRFGMDKKVLPADGVVTGIGYVSGRPVAAFSQDFTVAGGTLGKAHAVKICEVMDYAEKCGIPVVGFNDSGGARIQDGVDSLSGYGHVFNHNVRLSGVVPQIAVICGPCAGGAAYSPALMDFIIMTKTRSFMFICGPEVIKAITGQETSVEEIGSAEVHASISGNIHFVAENDLHAMEIVHQLLSYLPSNNMTDPPHNLDYDLVLGEDEELNNIVPESSKTPFDVKQVIARIADDGAFVEVQEAFATNIVVGFGRIGGIVVGFVANQPMVKAGALDIDASDKASRFIRQCDTFNVPIISLVDVPGFLPGVNEEKRGIIRHGAKMLFAYGSATVPKLSVIMRKAYGGSFLAMCSRDMGADLVLAWPTAEIAVMGAEGAVNVLYRNELKTAEDPKARADELINEYRDEFSSPYLSAGKLFVHDIIEPSQTRAQLALALRSLLSKRERRPHKKHGNIPL